MSIRLMTEVWQLDLPHAEKIVLLALADNASDDGECYPSNATLMKKCGLEERSIRRITSRLEQAGHITCHYRNGRSTVYTVHPGLSVPPDRESPRTESPHTPDRESPTPDPQPPPSLLRKDLTITQPSGNRHNARKRARRPAASDIPPEFEELKTLYPKRSGGQNWSGALRNCVTRLKEGYTWEQMLEGARRYAAFCSATGKLRSEYVKQACTFFGNDRHFLEDWSPPPSKAQAKQDKTVDVSLRWLEKRRALHASH